MRKTVYPNPWPLTKLPYLDSWIIYIFSSVRLEVLHHLLSTASSPETKSPIERANSALFFQVKWETFFEEMRGNGHTACESIERVWARDSEWNLISSIYRHWEHQPKASWCCRCSGIISDWYGDFVLYQKSFWCLLHQHILPKWKFGDFLAINSNNWGNNVVTPTMFRSLWNNLVLQAVIKQEFDGGNQKFSYCKMLSWHRGIPQMPFENYTRIGNLMGDSGASVNSQLWRHIRFKHELWIINLYSNSDKLFLSSDYSRMRYYP